MTQRTCRTGFAWVAMLLLSVTSVAADPAPPGEVGETLERVDAAIRDLPAEDRMVAWRYEPPRFQHISRAWPLGDSVAFTTVEGGGVMRFDPAAGKDPTPLMEGTRDEVRDAWVVPVPADGGGAALVALGKRVVTIDGRDGSRQVAFDLDSRIAPVPYAGGFVAPAGSQGQVMVRVDRDGREVWRCPLPGYVQAHPVARKSVMIVQTRQSSYGGQATSGIDLETGRLLWKDVVDAYGSGAAFAEDRSLVVESNQWLNPEGTEGRLVCREPTSGKRIWEVRRKGGMNHVPVVGTLLNRVFAVFDTGRVVCLNGRTGDVWWETDLPRPPHRVPVMLYQSDWPVMRLYENRLMVFDAGGTLHWLDIEDGRVVASTGLIGDAPDGWGVWRANDVVAMPWLQGKDGERLVVPTAAGIVAYPTRHLSAGRESPEAVLRGRRVKLLIRKGDVEAAAAELDVLRALRPAAAVTLECAAELAVAKNDTDGEVAARLALMRVEGRRHDPRLEAMTGLASRAWCGPSPTPPLVIDGRVYVGSADGKVRAFEADTLKPAGEFDAGAAASAPLAVYDGVIVLPTASRRVLGVSLDLKKQVFDFPQAIPESAYLEVSGRLLRSSRLMSYSEAAVLDLEQNRVTAPVTVSNTSHLLEAPVAHNGRAYYPLADGGSASFDGQVLEVHPPVLAGADAPKGPGAMAYRVNGLGDKPVAYGRGGAFEVDEHLRPARRLPGPPERCRSACRAGGVVVAVSEQARQTDDWLLEAWTADGRKLPLRYAMPRYGPGVVAGPRLVPLGDAFLLVGREVVSVDPHRERPLRRVQPGGAQDLEGFGPPAVAAGHVFLTHRTGDLYAFDRVQLTRVADEPRAPGEK